jgi:2-hydroxy-3-keto-5-methylthiopentenyl-1-phosphate phosphatase
VASCSVVDGVKRATGAEPRIVLDWDGTVTEVDGLDLVLSEFGDREVYARVESELGRTLRLNEVIAAEFATVNAPLEEVVSWLVRRTRVRPGFREFCARHRPLIVSSGFRELIDPILEREQIPHDRYELRANGIEPRPEGWRAVFRDGAVCETCSEPCKRADLPEDFTVFVGDGYADRCAALAADRVFATGGLVPYLDARRKPHERFVDFFQLAAALDGQAP